MSLKNQVRRIKKVLRHPGVLITRILMKESVGKHISDETFLKIVYRLNVGKKLDLNNPKTFTEKTQWLKLYNNSDLCTRVVDKAQSKEWFLEKFPDGRIIPTLGCWGKFDDIDISKLPDEFVLKCTHDSSSVVICKDKSLFDKKNARKRLSRKLAHNYFWAGREYPYKNVPPRIIAEPFMRDKKSNDLPDFKFFCFNGVPKILFYASGRFRDSYSLPYFDYYDMDLNLLDIYSEGHQHSPNRLKPFPQFEEMKNKAEILSQGFPFVRVDFYLINGEVFFGEMTFHHDGGIVPFKPEKWDVILGDWIHLPQ